MSFYDLVYEWWVGDGQNALEGIPGSACVPPVTPPVIDECSGEVISPVHGAVLSDEMIIEFLRSSPAARDSFYRLLPVMSLEEQARLTALINGPAKYLKADQKELDRVFVRAMNGMPQVRRGPGPLPPGDPRRR